MIRFLLIWMIVVWNTTVSAQEHISITLVSPDNEPVEGALIQVQNGNFQTSSDSDGRFYISSVLLPDSLIVTHLGFDDISRYMTVNDDGTEIALQYKRTELQDVMVSTGYYEISQRNATGSFDYVSQKTFENIVSYDIIGKLEGVVAGVQFNRDRFAHESRTDEPDIRVRGVNTLFSDTRPLIVLDNFPFEGDVNSINPHEIESITILKDAAAASIWGARAGNGVLVIKTKKGKYNQKARITYQGSYNTVEKPDLFYDRSYIPLDQRMELEKEFFENGIYAERDWEPLTDYVELLIEKRDGLISEEDFLSTEVAMKSRDIRDEATRLLYRNQTMSQNTLSVNGGTSFINYFLTVGYDTDKGSLRGNNSNRLNLSSSNSLQLTNRLELTTNIRLTSAKGDENGLSYTDIQPSQFSLPFYSRLADDEGKHLAIPHQWRTTYVENAPNEGLEDWGFRPLDEIENADNKYSNTRIMLQAGLKYNLLDNLSSEVKYQYWMDRVEQERYYSEDTYYTRNLVNQFTQSDGTRIIPYGGVLTGSNSYNNSHSGRFQLNYNNDFVDHRLNALAGVEVRQDFRGSTPGFILYDYDNDFLTSTTQFNYMERYPLRPRGSSQVTLPPNTILDITDRFLSYYGNVGYSYLRRYAVSVSSRWDASNLFGVKTNQKGTPLWSIGGSWEINKENFYNIHWLPYLKVRATYGYNGNINRSVSVFPKITYRTNNMTVLPFATLRSAGNPGLRWEQVATMNAGLDFRLKKNRVVGSVDFYKKVSTDLIGYDIVDPTTGIFDLNGNFEIDNRLNYANMEVKGIDLTLNTLNLDGEFKWRSQFLFSLVKNKITDYMEEQSSSISAYWSNPPPVHGKSKDVLYAIPWNGLDGEDGSPIIYIDGERSDDYALFMRQLQVEDLIEAGVRIAPYYGAVQNTFTWKNLSFSANITWKAGHSFRRKSIGYSGLSSGNGHLDYLDRWQSPGDELHTQVPSRPTENNAYRNQVYLSSDLLIEKGDHIRLQDVNLSYAFSRLNNRWPIENVHIFMYAKNLGILWRANKHGLDPDLPNAVYPIPTSVALGLKVQFK